MDGRPLVFDLKGSTITIPDIPGRPPSTRILHIKRVWRDIFERELGLIHVLCLVENILTRERHIAKIRYELNPKHFKFDNLHAQRDLAEYRFKCEVDAARLLGDNEYGPRYMTHWKQIQSINMPFPGGLIYFLIMGTVPGDIIPENLHDKLTDAQRVDIRRQLTRMLELLRLKGLIFHNQHFSYLRYFGPRNKLYLVDLSSLKPGHPDIRGAAPINEHHPYVVAFNILRRQRSGTHPGSPIATSS